MENLKKLWMEEERCAFSGWDFSHLKGRVVSEELPWDYRIEVLRGLQPEHRMLDMGTGGGEYLLSLGHPHKNTAVTEGYAPNLALCRERLAPLGVTVVGASGEERLPFEDESFDRVLNRQAPFLVPELMRVLRPGGRFVTQQVGGRNCFDLRKRLGFEAPPSEHDLEHNAALLEAEGFEILRAEESMKKCRFLDSGAVVFQARIIEWEFPGFTVEKCWKQLMEIQREIERNGCITATEHRFLIVAQKR